MNKAFLLLGGNLGNRKENLQTATGLIEKQCGKIIRLSSIYETAAWGRTDQPAFLNQAIAIETKLDPEQLINELLKIEKIMGRERKEKYGTRSIDIDILLYNHEQYNSPLLTIPHPELQNRRFALIPLTEIAPFYQHPVLKKSISRLLEECPDKLDVKRYS